MRKSQRGVHDFFKLKRPTEEEKEPRKLRSKLKELKREQFWMFWQLACRLDIIKLRSSVEAGKIMMKVIEKEIAPYESPSSQDNGKVSKRYKN